MHPDDRVLQLGALKPLLDTSDALKACQEMGVRAAQLLRANRTVGLAARRLGIRDDTEFGAEFAMHRERLADRVSMIDHSVELVTDIANRNGVAFYGMKGLAMRPFYLKPTDRDVRDVDLWVTNVDEAGCLARWLRRTGFVHDPNELPWIKRADGVTYGQIRLSAKEPGLAPVDVHFGPYSVGHRGRLPLTSSATTHVPGSLSLLSADVNLRATLGNATGDCLITTKDLNDYLLVVETMSDWLWEEHVRLAARVGSLRMLRTIMSRLVSTQHTGTVVTKRERALHRRGILPLRLNRLPDAQYRTRATVRRAIVQAQRAGEGSGLTTGISAWRYYRKPLQLHVAESTETAAETPTLASAAADRCLRLVPVELISGNPPSSPKEGSSGLHTVSTAHGELCELAGTLYIPTVDYRLSSALVADLIDRSDGGQNLSQTEAEE